MDGDHQMILAMGGRVWFNTRGVFTTRGTRGLLLVWQTVLLLRTYRKHQEFRVACQGRVHWANAWRMGSRNTPFARKSCVCASIAFLAWVISLAVDYNSRVVGADCLLFAFVCCVVSTLTWKLNFCSCLNSGAKLIDRRNYVSVLVAFLRELIVVTGTVNFLMCWSLNERSWPSQSFGMMFGITIRVFLWLLDWGSKV
jgi:hypothetical protein